MASARPGWRQSKSPATVATPTMATSTAATTAVEAKAETRLPAGASTVRAPVTGQAFTHSLHEIHSLEVTTSAVATAMFIMQALSQRPQSMHAEALRRMRRR